MDRAEENGVIAETQLGIEDHGILVAMVAIRFEGTEQGYVVTLGAENCYIALRSILVALEVNSWEDLKGVAVRAQREKGLITRIGHIYKDQWSKQTEEQA